MTDVNPTIYVVGLVSVMLLVAVIWLGWSGQAWMPKWAANAIRKFVGAVSALLLVGIIWIGWEFRPWMPAGRALHLSSERIGDYEFQIWQRKNSGIGEPFATGLFARRQGGRWNAFLLDFEDGYHPNITLRREGSNLAIFYGAEKWGYFDEAQQQVFRRHYADGTYLPRSGEVLASEPPGDWWLKQSLVP